MAKPTKSMPNRHTRRISQATRTLSPVQTDPNFARVFADQAIVMVLGHDVDIAFVAVSPKIDLVSSRADQENVAFRMTPGFSEVARVRMPPGSAAATAVAIIQKMIEQGIINKAGLLETIEEFQEPAVEDNEEVAEMVGEL